MVAVISVFIVESYNDDNHDLYGVFSTVRLARSEAIKHCRDFLWMSNVSKTLYLGRAISVAEWEVDGKELNRWYLEYNGEKDLFYWEKGA